MPDILTTLRDRGDTVLLKKGVVSVVAASGKAVPKNWIARNQAKLIEDIRWYESLGDKTLRFDPGQPSRVGEYGTTKCTPSGFCFPQDQTHDEWMEDYNRG